MSIEYLEIRNQNFEIAGICDVFESIIWHVKYYGVGDFEIYAPVSAVNLALLIEDNYITRPNDDEIGIIENVEYSFDAINGRMITATGRFAKSILARRLTVSSIVQGVPIPYELSGNVEMAARDLIFDNAIRCIYEPEREIDELVLGTLQGFTETIIDENGDATKIQTFLDNLLTWTDEFLKKYNLAARIILNADNKLEYLVYRGKNRAIDNTDGNAPVIFSQDYENLISSNFISNKANYKNYAIIGGESTGDVRYYAATETTETGLHRREIFIDGSKTTRAKSGSTITVNDYIKQLRALAVQTLADLANYQSFSGEINLNALTFKYKTDYNIGDIITIQDSDTKIFINTRIIELTEVQDKNGYQLSGKYET